MGRVRALDGLRGLALLGMMAWHAQVSWVRGGFARMTIFFVLAGFLATRSLLRLRAEGRSRPFLSFWGRRARRLLPITALGTLAAVGVTAWIGGATARQDVVGDVASVLGSFSNWRFIANDRPYGAMFESPNAFMHFWSLSVEEQCFLLLPLFLGVAVFVSRRRSGPGPAVALLVAAAALATLPALIAQRPDTVYFGTHVRAGEFLVGAAFAWWWSSRPATRGPAATRAWGFAGAAGLMVLVVVMLSLDRDATWLYRGGMGIFAVPAAAVIGGIMVGAPAVSTVLGVAPLAVLGRWAFSVYAFHWPIFLVVEDRLAGHPRHEVVLVEMALAVAVGGLVHHLVERPLQPGAHTGLSRAWADRQIMSPATALGVEFCLVAALLVPAVAPSIDFSAAPADAGTELEVAAASEARGDAAAPPAADATMAPTVRMSPEQAQAILDAADAEKIPMPVLRDPVRTGVGFFGGSTALTTALGGHALEAERPDIQAVPGYAPLGCGLLVSGTRRDRTAVRERLPDGPPPATCTQVEARWSATVRLYDLDVAVVPASRADLVEWDLDGSGQWRTLGDPVLDTLLARQLVTLSAALADGGARHIIILTPIRPSPRWSPPDREQRVAQATAYRALLDRVTADQVGPATIEVVDLYAWSQQLSDDTYLRYFPDGVHPSQVGAERIWVELLGPAIPRDLRTGGRETAQQRADG